MARYYADGEECWLADRRGAATLVLSDGSVWEVGDADSAKDRLVDSFFDDVGRGDRDRWPNRLHPRKQILRHRRAGKIPGNARRAGWRVIQDRNPPAVR